MIITRQILALCTFSVIASLPWNIACWNSTFLHTGQVFLPDLIHSKMSSLQNTWPQASLVGALVASNSSQQVGQWSPSTVSGFSSGFSASKYGSFFGRSRTSGSGFDVGKRWFHKIMKVKTTKAYIGYLKSGAAKPVASSRVQKICDIVLVRFDSLEFIL